MKAMAQGTEETVETVGRIGDKATDIAEKGSNWLKNASGMEIAILIALGLVVLAVGFVFFKIYGCGEGLNKLKNRYEGKNDEEDPKPAAANPAAFAEDECVPGEEGEVDTPV